MKRCKACNLLLPVTEFHKRKRAADGRLPICKKCRSIARGFTPRQNFVQPDGQKQCKWCGIVHPNTFQFFHKSNGKPSQPCLDCVRKNIRERKYWQSEHAKARAHQYYLDHADRIVKRVRQWKTEHPKQTLEHQYRYDARHPEQVREKKRRSYLRHPEYAVKNRESRRATQRRWHQNHLDKHRIEQQKRRARKRRLPANFSEQDWLRALKYFGGRCAICGRPPGLWHMLSQDHWIPVASGGGYTPDNIIPLCHGIDGCNNSKGKRDPLEWLENRLGKQKGRRKAKEIAAYFEATKELASG